MAPRHESAVGRLRRLVFVRRLENAAPSGSCFETGHRSASAAVNCLRRFVLLLLGGAVIWAGNIAGAAEAVRVVETKTLHNVFKIEGGLYSGNAPEDEEGFRELQKL